MALSESGQPRLLVLRALGLGDLLTGLPALRALAQLWPGHLRVLAAPEPLGSLMVWAGAADEVLDTRSLGPLAWTGRPPEVAVNLHGSGPESHQALLATESGRLVAYASPAVPGVAGPRWDPAEHEVDRWCRLVSSAGSVSPAAARPDPDDLLLPPAGVEPPVRDAVVVHPGAAFGARRWPAERFAEVAAALHDAGHHVVVTGSPDERQLATGVAAASGLPSDRVLAGRTSLSELTALLQVARLLICGDTGVGHLGTACGTPTVHLFGPEPPSRWAPRIQPERHVVLWHPEAHDRYGRVDGRDEVCDPALAAIRSSEVIETADALLARGRPLATLS